MPISVKIMPDTASTTGPLVAVLAYDGLCTFEFGVAYEVFGLPRPEMGPGWYGYVACAIEAGPLHAAGGLTVVVDAGLDRLAGADLIVAPGWRGIDAPVPPDLVAALRQAHASGARILSLCSGIAVLAAAGFLDGRRATTHWRYAEAIRARYPAIDLDPARLYVDEGDVLTAAGSAAGIDLCLHVVRRDFGPDAANSVARRLVVPPHREGGQAQFIERPMPRERAGTRLGPLIDWLRANLAAPHSIETIAARSGMSARTLQRRFEEATGLPPGEWLVAERVGLAREQLERNGGATVADIALACGFGTVETMRHHFRRRVGVSPAAYRARFAA
ncbi:transcriptional regulator FtrA [Labrys monachus]|uniref:AraC family transcriptional activator FtrA n=1 Tax=Labrys monachus TaxID=217067 RepID=A0ABU0FK07_9HYPH|nr:transcriptional regulator FtrA [Labrys monachus]MDQ0394940.1 AraC family transcriptional activator FtrA [Labrys monachus]